MAAEEIDVVSLQAVELAPPDAGVGSREYENAVSPVEAVIALSIMFVASELVQRRPGQERLSERFPWTVSFSFGLLHGFGFAGALSEIGLPEHAIPLALLFFNVGVELGQLAFIAAVLLAWAALKRLSWPEWAWRVPVYTIGSLAAFWTIERIAGFA